MNMKAPEAHASLGNLDNSPPRKFAPDNSSKD